MPDQNKPSRRQLNAAAVTVLGAAAVPSTSRSYAKMKSPAASAVAMSGRSVAQISAGASVDHQGQVHLSLANLHHDQPATVSCDLRGVKASTVSGRVFTTAAINTFNSFDAPDRANPAALDGAKVANKGLTVELPAKSVVILEIGS